jgi:hypothetical protein
MRTLASKRPGRAGRRRGVVAGGLAAFVGMFVVATAIPASAHEPLFGTYTVCSDGNHHITWSIGNSEPVQVMHIVSATATLGGQTFAVTNYNADLGGYTWTGANTVIPGGDTGTVTLTVSTRWDDGFTAQGSTSVTLSSGCSTSTTTSSSTSTTESTSTSTSTTEAPTSTTEAPTSSTTIEGSTTIPSSTTVSSTPISGEGSTVQTSTTVKTGALGSTSTTAPTGVTAASTPTTTGNGSLPFTGNSNAGPMFGLASLVAGGVALAFTHNRRKKPTA